ncbi:Haloacid dehalogenase-like hydrolase [Tribonema minus]|uniref:Haloacid dehalogenase-like hydrolase n=1 Tax=Tribonema minus TaxID=303371 RepID=A0A836CC37_9STRA|nr:Haloacid dehalogenase-like hydrolase [Tribonema minus]
MQVAFWEIAPYLCTDDPAELEGQMESYVRNNAGKAFEFMLEACEAERKQAGLQPLETAQGEHPHVLALVDVQRAALGLPPLRQTSYDTLLAQQKDETVQSLSKVARPVKGMRDALMSLTASGVPFAISTTSPKPRVPVSITSCGFDEFFPPHKVHSGESDFDPPRFKPAPDVYLRQGGVGSASNAGMGLIVGYVGASHIPLALKGTHAEALMAGKRAADGRGADVVIEHMADLLPLVVS